MTKPALTRHQLSRFMRDNGCSLIRICSTNHELWRDKATGKALTISPTVSSVGTITQMLNRLRRIT